LTYYNSLFEYCSNPLANTFCLLTSYFLFIFSYLYSVEDSNDYQIGTRANLKKYYSETSAIEFTNYIEQFFVGLLEGDGRITVDFISNRTKRVRIFIALNNLEDNRFMLNLIVNHIGGRVAIERNNSYVT